MTAPLHVLVVGSDSDANVCSVYRTGMFVPHLAALGVEVRHALPTFESEGAAETDDVAEAIRSGQSEFERTMLEWADVVVFRRAYQTHLLCLNCGFASLDPVAAGEHAGRTRHTVEIGPHFLVRPLFERLEAAPDRLGATGLVYETDDDLFSIPAANAYHRLYANEADLMRRMARLADLVTVSTPVLASRLRPLNREVRVLRNAVDPAWYEGEPQVRPPGEPRILYYGSVGRLKDYEICRSAVDVVAREYRGTRRVWLGASDVEEHRRLLSAVADELRPYVVGVPAFARALRDACPDIGLAPVQGDVFDRAKSELHWLEYSMAGAATVASRTMDEGPYRVVRPGVDGLLARGAGEWRDALRRLAGSAGLRTEMAGRARERVLAEYDARKRAGEWADAFHWAVEHGGSAKGPAPSASGARSGGGAAGQVARSASVRTPGRGPAPAAAGAVPGALPDPAALFEAYVAARAFAGRSPLRLHLGCGAARFDGFVNIDADERRHPDLRLDPAFGLPFDDGTVTAIYAWRVIDELGDVARVFAAEAARVLRPGGVLRLLTRDRDAAIERRDRLAAQGVVLGGEAATLPSLSTPEVCEVLASAGFAAVAIVPPDASCADELRGLESRRAAELPDDLLIVEARR